MATFTKQEFTIIPAETIVTAEVVNAEEKETPFWADENDHSKGKSRQVSFRFKVLGGEYDDTIIFGNTGVYYSDNSKLGGWVREILAVDELPEEFDTDNLIGAVVKIIIGNRSKDVNGVQTITGHFAETIARVTDDDYLAADEVF
jgi:hypothetical protein